MGQSRIQRVAQSIRAILHPQDLPAPTEYSELPHMKFQGKGGNVAFEFETSDGHTYVVDFEKEDTQEAWDGNVWEVAFGLQESEGRVNVHPVYHSENKVEVMQGVAAKIRDFIEHYLPGELTFTPTSKSRGKLYLAMVRRLLPGVEVVHEGLFDIVLKFPRDDDDEEPDEYS